MKPFFTVALLSAASLMNSVSLGSQAGGSSGAGILSTPESHEGSSGGGSTGSNGQTGTDGTWTSSPIVDSSSSNVGQGLGSGGSFGSGQIPHRLFDGLGGNYLGSYWGANYGGLPWGYPGNYLGIYPGSYPVFHPGFGGHSIGVRPHVTAHPYGFLLVHQPSVSWGYGYGPSAAGYTQGFGTWRAHYTSGYGVPGVHHGAFGHPWSHGGHRYGASQVRVGSSSAPGHKAVSGFPGC